MSDMSSQGAATNENCPWCGTKFFAGEETFTGDFSDFITECFGITIPPEHHKVARVCRSCAEKMIDAHIVRSWILDMNALVCTYRNDGRHSPTSATPSVSDQNRILESSPSTSTGNQRPEVRKNKKQLSDDIMCGMCTMEFMLNRTLKMPSRREMKDFKKQQWKDPKSGLPLCIRCSRGFKTPNYLPYYSWTQ